MFSRTRAWGILVILFLHPNAATAGGDQLAARRIIPQTLALQDASGTVHALEPRSDEVARVFVFLTGECPISRRYVPELNRLHETWSRPAGKIAFRGVWADVTTPPAAIARFAREHGIEFPILVDRDGELARRFEPTHVPEAFVLDAEGALAYRGRIDDAYLALGRPRPAATRRDLADAVEALVSGRAIGTRRTEPVGCFYETPPAASRGGETVTWARDVAPILYANCVVCHREGEVGPFVLTGYLDAAKRARQIARVVESGLMPPWKAAQTHGEFVGQRTLSSRQIETIRKWAEGGRDEGDPSEAPKAPVFPSGWRLGKPDLVLEMPSDFDVPADGPDLYQNFVIPVDLPEDRRVAVAEFVPGNPAVVHHSLLFLDARGAARRLDARTPEPGYATFGSPGFVPSGSIGGWSPGKSPRRLPNDLGRMFKKGSDLVMQIHYHPNGKVEKDRSRVGIYFVDRPGGVAAAIWASAFSHDIPPGERNYRVAASFTLPVDVTMLGCVPHMHLLGRELSAVAVLPGGERRPLIDIPRWDFNWQEEYHFARPFELPRGTRLEVEAVYDNSSDNPSNPSSPPRRVTWGEGTTDEMLYCFFLIAASKPDELPLLMRSVLTQEAVGRMAARFRGKRGGAGVSLPPEQSGNEGAAGGRVQD